MRIGRVALLLLVVPGCGAPDRPAATPTTTSTTAPAAQVSGRQLTDTERATMLQTLAAEQGPVRKVWFAVPAGDAEAGALADAFSSVFKQAGWEPVTQRMTGITLKPGLSILMAEEEPPSYANVAAASARVDRLPVQERYRLSAVLRGTPESRSELAGHPAVARPGLRRRRRSEAPAVIDRRRKHPRPAPAASCSAACRGPAPDRRRGCRRRSRVGKQLGQDAERRAVGRVVEGRAPARRRWRCRSWRSSPAGAGRRRRAARASAASTTRSERVVLVGHAAEAVAVLAQAARSSRRAGSSHDGDDHGARVDEAGEVVDVAVRVVAGDARAEPEHLADAEVVGEAPARARRGEVRGCAPGRAEQALLGGEQRAAAVDVDGAALEHDAAATPSIGAGCQSGRRSRRASARGDRGVAAVVRILGPAVEAPVDRGRRRRSRDCARRAGRSRASRRGRWGMRNEVDARRGRRRRARAACARLALQAPRRCTRMRTRSPGARWRTISA